MRTFYFFLFTTLLLTACSNLQEHGSTELEIEKQSFSQYDSLLADSLGADQYGMRSYVMAFLKSGDTIIKEDSTRQKLFRGHLDNIVRLEEEGKMVLAGPFGKNNQSYRGLFLFNSSDTSEVKNWLSTDPAINAGVFDVDIIEWYGSAAIPTYLPTHYQIEKEKP